MKKKTEYNDWSSNKVPAPGRGSPGLGLCLGVLPCPLRLHRDLLHPGSLPRLRPLQQVWRRKIGALNKYFKKVEVQEDGWENGVPPPSHISSYLSVAVFSRAVLPFLFCTHHKLLSSSSFLRNRGEEKGAKTLLFYLISWRSFLLQFHLPLKYSSGKEKIACFQVSLSILFPAIVPFSCFKYRLDLIKGYCRQGDLYKQDLIRWPHLYTIRPKNGSIKSPQTLTSNIRTLDIKSISFPLCSLIKTDSDAAVIPEGRIRETSIIYRRTLGRKRKKGWKAKVSCFRFPPFSA